MHETPLESGRERMFLKTKGKYLQAWERVKGKQKMVEHLGSLEQLVKIVREHKAEKERVRALITHEKVGNSPSE